MSTFVLVPGAWHGSWCWEFIVPLLEAKGHRAIAPELFGMGENRADAAKATVPIWGDQIAELIEGLDEPVILVGHSRGGVVISEAAERVPDRIAKLVYLTACLLRPGETIVESASRVRRKDGGGPPQPDEDGTFSLAQEAVGPAFYNTTRDDLVDRAISFLSPEPYASVNFALTVTPERFGKVPRAYIECLQDRAITLELQRLMQEHLPCDPVISLDTDHSPFYSAPEELAAALIDIAEGA